MADKQTPPTPVTSVVRPQGVISDGQVRRRKLKVVLLATLVVVAIGIFLWWYIVRPEFGAKNAQPARSVAQQRAFDRAIEIEQLTADDPIIQANQLAGAGVAYAEANAHERALDMFLQAQTVVDNKQIDMNSQRYYFPIAQQYAALSNNSKAREFYDKEIQFLEKQNPIDQMALDTAKKEKAKL